MPGSDGPRRPASSPPLAQRAFTVVLLTGIALLLPSAAVLAAERPWEVLGWIALLSASSLITLVTVPKLQVEASSIHTPVAIASLVVLPPGAALIVNLVGLASGRELRRGVSPWMILYNHAQLGLTAYAAALVVQAQPFGTVVGWLIAVGIYDLINSAIVTVSTWLGGRGGLREAARGAAMPFPSFASNYIVTGLLAVLIVVLYQQVSPWAVALLAVPLWLGYAAMRSAKTADERADELALRVRELEVVHQLGTALLSARGEDDVLGLGRTALRAICEDAVLAPEGVRPEHLQERVLPGTGVRLWVPVELDERRAAEIETVCSAVGLALQRLAVEEELQESQRAEAALAQGILAEGTAARSRLALNMHDGVLPYLAAAQIQSDNVLTAVEMGDASKAKGLAVRVREAVSDGITALRSVLDDLKRQTIVPGDLMPAIEQAAEQAQLEHGLVVAIDVDGFDGGLSHPVEILLTETITGLLTNVVRHARATEARVKLLSEQGYVVAEVSDDGSGFVPEAVGAGHHGLALMDQRAALAHGQFVIDSAPGRGTSIRLRVPAGTASATHPLLVPHSAPGEPAQAETREPHAAGVSR